MNNKIRLSHGDRVFNAINCGILFIVFLVVLYPLYFIAIASFSNPHAVSSGRVILLPQQVTFEGYKRIFEDVKIWNGFRNSLFLASVGTLINLFVALLAGYALSRGELKGRRALMVFFIFTMYFQGGIVPSYILVKNLNLINSFWALILPNAVNVYYLIIARTFFSSSQFAEIQESTRIDGASHVTFFLKFALPLSKALIAVLALFFALMHWNKWFEASLYMTEQARWPLQLVLRSILVTVDYSSQATVDAASIEEAERIKALVKYGVIIVASVPVLAIYPFVQRFFVTGVMIGSVKG